MLLKVGVADTLEKKDKVRPVSKNVDKRNAGKKR